MKCFMVPQGDAEWWSLRRGLPTASDFDKIITPVKGDLSKQADEYIDELIADMINPSPQYFTEKGTPINTYAVQQGKATEPEARRWLALEANMDVTQVGFCVADDFSMGCSPDGLIGFQIDPEADGEWRGIPHFKCSAAATVELKCPLLRTHLGYVRKGVLPPEYKPQVHGHLIVTGAPAVEFVSYGAGSPQQLRIRVERDEYTDKVEAGVREFVGRYNDALKRILGRSHL